MERDAVQCGTDVPTFRSNLLPLLSGQKLHLLLLLRQRQ